MDLSSSDKNFLYNQWNLNGRLAETKTVVELGVEYSFPLNEDVKVTFTKLPEEKSTLRIEEISLSAELQAQLGTVSEYAYDITTDMNDGDFEFDLVLPAAEANVEEIEVKYAENISELESAAKNIEKAVEVEGGKAKVKAVDHMTVFVVTSPNPVSTDCSDAGVGIVGTDRCFNSIQDAVIAALDGEEIHVSSGIYEEQISIVNKDVKITGEGKGNTIIRSPELLNTSFVTSSNNKVVFYVNGGNVEVSNLTIDGFYRGNSNYRMIGLGFYNASGLVDNVEVINIQNSPANGAQHGNAIYAYNNDGISRFISVKNSSVENFQKNGITMNGSNLSATVENNDVQCYGQIDFIAQNGIQMGYGVTGSVLNNRIDGCSFVNEASSYNRASAGILLYDVGDSINISSNILSNNDMGVAAYYLGSGLSVNNNIFNSNYVGFQTYDVLDGNEITFLNNSFNGNNWDIDNYDSEDIDASSTIAWSVDDQTDYDKIESVVNHYCEGSKYVHGQCSDTDDYSSADFGSVRYKKIENPVNSGWNLFSKSTTPNELPLDLSCSSSNDLYTNENKVAQNWTSVSGVNIKYQREVTYPSGLVRYFNAGTKNYTPFSVFGSALGIEGLWKTRVIAYVDSNANNVYDSGEDSSEWSNYCNINFDRSKPTTPQITSPAETDYLRGNPLQTWTDISDADHYLYESFWDENLTDKVYETTVYTNSKRVTGNQTVTFWWHVKAVDAAGNESDWSTARKMIVDNTNPVVSINDLVINDNTPELTGTVSDNNGISSIEVNVDGQVLSATDNNDGTWTLANDSLSALADGLYDVSVKATDLAGNTAFDSSTDELRIDTVAPTATFKHYISGDLFSGEIAFVNDINLLSFDGFYEDQEPSSLLKQDSFVIFDADQNGNPSFRTTSYCGWRSGNNTISISGLTDTLLGVPLTYCEDSLGEGEYYVRHQVYDSAIRKDIPTITQFRDVLGLHFIIDQTKPTVASSIDPVSPDGSNSWYRTRPTITITAEDPANLRINEITKIQYQWDSNSGSWVDYTVPVQVQSEGTHTLYYRAFDKAGNVSDEASVSVNFDQTAPNPGPENLKITNLSLPTATLEWDSAADAISGIEKYDISWKLKGTTISHGDSAGSGDTSFDLDNLSDGEWEIRVKALDNAGNWTETLLLYTIGGGVGTSGETSTTSSNPPAVLGATTTFAAPQERAGEVEGATDEATEAEQKAMIEEMGGEVAGASTTAVAKVWFWLGLALVFTMVFFSAFMKEAWHKILVFVLVPLLIALAYTKLLGDPNFEAAIMKWMDNMYLVPAYLTAVMAKLLTLFFVED
jgi:hypothetical protein